MKPQERVRREHRGPGSFLFDVSTCYLLPTHAGHALAVGTCCLVLCGGERGKEEIVGHNSGDPDFKSLHQLFLLFVIWLCPKRRLSNRGLDPL